MRSRNLQLLSVESSQCSKYKPEAVIRSIYGHCDVGDSPDLFRLACAENVRTGEIAGIFAEGLCGSCKRPAIQAYTFACDEENPPPYTKVLSDTAGLFRQYNDTVIAEFEKRKNEPEYQHRDDWGPDASLRS